MMTRRLFAPLSVAALALASAGLMLAQPVLAQAKPAQLQAAQSELAFTSKQMGVPVEGKFKRFDAQLAFDPKKPETGKVSFTIELGSASLGDAAVDAELVKPAWFDVKKIPQASFQSSAIKALGNHRYEVAGKLAIKGQTRDLVVPVTLAQSGANTTATGAFAIKRLDFKIGDGEWADTSMVANDVQVRFKLNFTGVAPL
jgi:polyisoprenoid-binding protein YceI